MITVPIKKLDPDALSPTYATYGDAGADLYSNEDVIIEPETYVLVKTGIALAIPEGYVGLVHPRSGLAARMGVTILNSPGTVDAGYRGEILVNLTNHGKHAFHITKGDRIAQIVFQEVEIADFVEVPELEESIRGEGGHGSTGGFNG